MNRLPDLFTAPERAFWLTGLINWELFEEEFGKLYAEEGRPGIPIRCWGLTYLSHALNLSDEEMVR